MAIYGAIRVCILEEKFMGEFWFKIEHKIKIFGRFIVMCAFFRYESLYATKALLSSFRIRSKNQLYLEHLDDYNKEILNLLENEVENNLCKIEKK
ncbi:hypothetical protein [Polaribacter atrinae]|uniref:hypothetical protein n=1 Tax=Polaribacter atrinae TaxID=1333662 RepID=UPI0012F90368|nr:hypothetical protein [Polaribacter atrinae]